MDPKMPGKTQATLGEPEHRDRRRDLEERHTQEDEHIREKTLDKTLADSFPTSDPPSSIPDPVAAHTPNDAQAAFDNLIADLPPGSWAVVSEDGTRVIGTGATREEAIQSARVEESKGMRVIRVPQDPEAPEQAA